MCVVTLIIQLFTCTTCNMCSTDSSNNGYQTQCDYELTDRHKCDECWASFTRKDNLSHHQLIHSSSFHKESGSESDHSTCDDSNMMSEMFGYDSGTERSGSDEKTKESGSGSEKVWSKTEVKFPPGSQYIPSARFRHSPDEDDDHDEDGDTTVTPLLVLQLQLLKRMMRKTRQDD